MQLISGKAIRHKNKIDTFMKMDLKINHGKGLYVLQYCKRAFLSTNLGRHVILDNRNFCITYSWSGHSGRK